ncbi:hypothetical protein I3842_05G152200 [Carya illinoinensis]|uniref:Uncharacterized protein n=1 Tax=Carya illinoinensis TaxID=32201 RepID=A0A922F177_CARIL|nr:hypothetical protein I3842_05G152200 [Carya illinoinensis]
MLPFMTWVDSTYLLDTFIALLVSFSGTNRTWRQNCLHIRLNSVLHGSIHIPCLLFEDSSPFKLLHSKLSHAAATVMKLYGQFPPTLSPTSSGIIMKPLCPPLCILRRPSTCHIFIRAPLGKIHTAANAGG